MKESQAEKSGGHGDILAAFPLLATLKNKDGGTREGKESNSEDILLSKTRSEERSWETVGNRKCSFELAHKVNLIYSLNNLLH